MMRGISVAIDGPAGAGKSTVSKLLAERTGLQLLDTGAMYRAFTWAWLQDLSSDPSIGAGKSVQNHQITVTYIDGKTVVQCDGVDISVAIRDAEITSRVSEVSAIPEVRERAVTMQRDLVEANVSRGIGVVLEGRDIGTTVLPDANLKFFLTADPAARAQRRALENGTDVGQVLKELEQRDAADTTRTVSPLRAAANAIHIDATNLTPDEVVRVMIEAIDALNI